MVIQDIHDLIKLGIHVNGITYLPGIGTFRIQRTPASYAADRKSILPPNSTLIFEDKEFEDFNIIALAEHCGLKASTTQLWLNDLVNSIKNNYATTLIRGIGVFEIKDGRPLFQQDTNTNWNGFLDWPVININPLMHANRNYEFAVTQPKELIHPWKKKGLDLSTWIFPTTAISIVVLFLIFRSCSPQTLENIPSSDMKETIENQENIVDSGTDYTVLTDSLQDMKVDTIQTQAASETELKSSEEAISKSLPSDSTCIFIVGSFLKYQNAKKLKNNLKKKGYTVDIYENKPFYRVGFAISCTTKTQLPVEILQKYPDVWLLEPILE